MIQYFLVFFPDLDMAIVYIIMDAKMQNKADRRIIILVVVGTLKLISRKGLPEESEL